MGEDTASREVSRILREAGEGRPVDAEALLPLVYEKLRAIATYRMAAERRDHTLQATALVHEAYLKLVDGAELDWAGKAHFYAAAGQAMRRILVDHARTRGRRKRGGGRRRVPLDVLDLAARADAEEILSVEDALRRLEKRDARLAATVQLRFFAGLSEGETAEALGVSDRTVRRDWVLARAWLQKEIAGG